MNVQLMHIADHVCDVLRNRVQVLSSVSENRRSRAAGELSSAPLKFRPTSTRYYLGEAPSSASIIASAQAMCPSKPSDSAIAR